MIYMYNWSSKICNYEELTSLLVINFHYFYYFVPFPFYKSAHFLDWSKIRTIRFEWIIYFLKTERKET